MLWVKANVSGIRLEPDFSIKTQELEFCPGRQLKVLLSGASVTRGLSGHLPHSSAPREVPHLPGPSLEHLIQHHV